MLPFFMTMLCLLPPMPQGDSCSTICTKVRKAEESLCSIEWQLDIRACGFDYPCETTGEHCSEFLFCYNLAAELYDHCMWCAEEDYDDCIAGCANKA